MDETELAPSEALTVVLSERGWVRAAKGYDVDPATLAYRAGDGFLDAVQVRSNQPVVFVDSTGRSYSLQAHALPSARGQGEPLTGKLAPPAGASFVAALGGGPEQRYVLASDAGYGFVGRFEDLCANKKAGKTVLTLPAGAAVLRPARVADATADRVAVASSDGHLLVFPVSELPAMERGKGNKLIALPAGKRGQPRPAAVAIACVPPAAAS